MLEIKRKSYSLWRKKKDSHGIHEILPEAKCRRSARSHKVLRNMNLKKAPSSSEKVESFPRRIRIIEYDVYTVFPRM